MKDVVDFLLSNEGDSICYCVRRDLLGEDIHSPEMMELQERILHSPTAQD